MEPQNQSTPSPQVEGAVGPVIATVIILAVIILGGIYFWAERTMSTETNPYGTTSTTEVGAPTQASYGTDNTTAVIESQSDSDNLDSIEADLQTTNTADIDNTLY